MRLRTNAFMVAVALLASLGVGAWAKPDLASMEAGVVSIRAEVAARIGGWNAAAERVEAAQAERADKASYLEDYELLLQAKTEAEAWEARLIGYLGDVLSHQQEQPDLAPGEQQLVERITGGIDGVSVVVDGLLMRVAAIEAVQAALEGGEAAAKTVEPDFRSTGDIAFSSGTGTYTDYDRQYFSFKQYYKDREERYFTFWQKYDNDHSFINLRRWEFGMAQEFPDFYGGELNLSEEYSEYRDADDRRNNRHEVALTMDYERWFNAERSLVDAAWRYKTKNFSIESPRSYIRHFAEVYGLHELSERVTTDAFWRFSDYHYSQGDVLGHNVTNLGLGFQFAPDSVWLWGLNYVSTEKSYDVQKASAFFENEYRVWTRYQPNVDEYGEGEIRLRDRDRRRSVVNDYDEARLKLRYWRQLNPELDGDFRLEWMEKDYSGANPASYDYWRWQTVFNYYPDYHTRWYYNFDYYDYDYSGLTRSYDRMYHRLGLNYNWECGAALTTELALTDQSYSANTGRDYIIWDFLADLYYPVERYQSVRLYFDWSRLDQSFANSVNDFKAVGWGAEYDWRLTPHYRLILSYDYDLRDYERQPRIKDQVLEARLRFDF